MQANGDQNESNQREIQKGSSSDFILVTHPLAHPSARTKVRVGKVAFVLFASFSSSLSTITTGRGGVPLLDGVLVLTSGGRLHEWLVDDIHWQVIRRGVCRGCVYTSVNAVEKNEGGKCQLDLPERHLTDQSLFPFPSE